MRSLVLISLPRSLSTLTYHLLVAALDLKQPSWTSDGEILNLDRHCLFRQASGAESRKFIDQRLEPERFRDLLDFLQDATSAEGFVYKDVVQPFAISSWLPDSGLKIIRIVRCLPDVAYAMIDKKWFYPGNAASVESDPEGAVIEGLVRARRALDQVPATIVDFDDLTVNEAALWEAVQRLYPDAEIAWQSYLDRTFQDVLSETLRRRHTQSYRRIESKCEETVARLGLC